MTHTGKNFTDAQADVKDGDTLEFCNFAQDEADTPICEGISGLTFVHCNLANCALPKDAVVKDCLHANIARPVYVPDGEPEEDRLDALPEWEVKGGLVYEGERAVARVKGGKPKDVEVKPNGK